MPEQFANDPGTTLSAAIVSTTRPVTFSVNAGGNWPTVPQFRVILGNQTASEILLVTAVNGGGSYTAATTEGSTAALWPIGTPVAHILSAGVMSAVPVWFKVTIPFTSLTAAATTQTLTLAALQARQMITGVVIKHGTAFSGGGLTAMTVLVGDSLQTAGFYSQVPFDVFQTVSDTAFQAVNTLGMSSFSGSTVQITFTSVGANVNAATAGSVDINIAVLTLP